jgi:hypothetical protein
VSVEHVQDIHENLRKRRFLVRNEHDRRTRQRIRRYDDRKNPNKRRWRSGLEHLIEQNGFQRQIYKFHCKFLKKNEKKETLKIMQLKTYQIFSRGAVFESKRRGQ